MQTGDLERKLRLPDPTKTIEGVWELLRRLGQQVITGRAKASLLSAAVGRPSPEERRALIAAERQKAWGIMNAARTIIR